MGGDHRNCKSDSDVSYDVSVARKHALREIRDPNRNQPQATLDALFDKISELAEKSDKQSQKIDALTREVGGLRAENGNLKNDVKVLGESNARLESIVKTMTAQDTKLRADVRSLTENNENLQQTVTALTAENTKNISVYGSRLENSKLIAIKLLGFTSIILHVLVALNLYHTQHKIFLSIFLVEKELEGQKKYAKKLVSRPTLLNELLYCKTFPGYHNV